MDALREALQAGRLAFAAREAVIAQLEAAVRKLLRERDDFRAAKASEAERHMRSLQEAEKHSVEGWSAANKARRELDEMQNTLHSLRMESRTGAMSRCCGGG